MDTCACQEIIDKDPNQDLLHLFSEVRAQCPALHQILIPDDVWPRFKQWHGRPDKVALHKSMLLLAFQRGYLERITSAIHRFLLRDDCNVSKQYLKDTRECWMFDSEKERRHQKILTILKEKSHARTAACKVQRGSYTVAFPQTGDGIVADRCIGRKYQVDFEVIDQRHVMENRPRP